MPMFRTGGDHQHPVDVVNEHVGLARLSAVPIAGHAAFRMRGKRADKRIRMLMTDEQFSAAMDVVPGLNVPGCGLLTELPQQMPISFANGEKQR